MSLSFIGPNGSVERRWIVYALLRDNVQHHIEGGASSAAFSSLHALGDALAKGEVRVGARSLHGELERAGALLDRPVAELAISVRTRAASTMQFPLPSEDGTMLASTANWTLPAALQSATTLREVFGSLVEELLQITQGAGEQDVVTVIDS